MSGGAENCSDVKECPAAKPLHLHFGLWMQVTVPQQQGGRSHSREDPGSSRGSEGSEGGGIEEENHNHVSIHCVQLGFESHFAVDASMSSWGLVKKGGADLKCLSKECSVQCKRCAHVQLINGQTEGAAGEVLGMT
jgi:hypothetical protein